VLVEPGKQLLDRPGLCEMLAKQPDCRRVPVLACLIFAQINAHCESEFRRPGQVFRSVQVHKYYFNVYINLFNYRFYLMLFWQNKPNHLWQGFPFFAGGVRYRLLRKSASD